jgi:hypothetical protein
MSADRKKQLKKRVANWCQCSRRHSGGTRTDENWCRVVYNDNPARALRRRLLGASSPRVNVVKSIVRTRTCRPTMSEHEEQTVFLPRCDPVRGLWGDRWSTPRTRSTREWRPCGSDVRWRERLSVSILEPSAVAEGEEVPAETGATMLLPPRHHLIAAGPFILRACTTSRGSFQSRSLFPQTFLK